MIKVKHNQLLQLRLIKKLNLKNKMKRKRFILLRLNQEMLKGKIMIRRLVIRSIYKIRI